MATVTAVLAVLVAVLAILLFVLLGVVIELFRDVRQLRDALGILDRPLHVDLGSVAGGNPSSYGLPKALDDEFSALVLFLHETCGTCESLAAALRGALPEGLWLVIEARTPESAGEFLRRYGLPETASRRVIVDAEQRSAGLLGLQTTPVAFRVQLGTIVSASTVPSSRYLWSILPNPIRLTPRQWKFGQLERLLSRTSSDVKGQHRAEGQQDS